MLPPPNCFLTKFDPATGLTHVHASSSRTPQTLRARSRSRRTTSRISRASSTRTGFRTIKARRSPRSTTRAASRWSAGSGSATTTRARSAKASTRIAVNSLGHVFLLGPCRLVGPGEPPLELSGYNETSGSGARTSLRRDAAPPTPGSSARRPTNSHGRRQQRTRSCTVRSSPRGSRPRSTASRPTTPTARTSWARSRSTFSRRPTPTVRRVRQAGTRGFDSCGYLMVLDTTTTGPSSLALCQLSLEHGERRERWRSAGSNGSRLHRERRTGVRRLSRAIARRIPSSWPYSLYPALTGRRPAGSLQPRRRNDMPSQLDFASVFDPSRGVAALAGQTVRDALADLRLFPSGALAVASVAYTTSARAAGHRDDVLTECGSGWSDLDPEPWHADPGGVRRRDGFRRESLPGWSGRQDRRSRTLTSSSSASTPSTRRRTSRRPSRSRILRRNRHDGVRGLTVRRDGQPLRHRRRSGRRPADLLVERAVHRQSGRPTNYVPRRRACPLGMQQDGHGDGGRRARQHRVGQPARSTSSAHRSSGRRRRRSTATFNGLVFNYAPVTITATAIGAGPSNAYLQTRLDQIPPIPSDLQAGSPPIYFDVSTDAALMQPADSGLRRHARHELRGSPASIRLYQYRHLGQLAAWTDITSAGLPAGESDCAAKPIRSARSRSSIRRCRRRRSRRSPATAFAWHSNDGPGGSPSTIYVDGPATATALAYLYGGAYDRANNHLFVSDGGYILRLNLNNNTIARVAGNGVIFPGIHRRARRRSARRPGRSGRCVQHLRRLPGGD